MMQKLRFFQYAFSCTMVTLFLIRGYTLHKQNRNIFTGSRAGLYALPWFAYTCMLVLGAPYAILRLYYQHVVNEDDLNEVPKLWDSKISRKSKLLLSYFLINTWTVWLALFCPFEYLMGPLGQIGSWILIGLICKLLDVSSKPSNSLEGENVQDLEKQ